MKAHILCYLCGQELLPSPGNWAIVCFHVGSSVLGTRVNGFLLAAETLMSDDIRDRGPDGRESSRNARLNSSPTVTALLPSERFNFRLLPLGDVALGKSPGEANYQILPRRVTLSVLGAELLQPWRRNPGDSVLEC